MKKKTSLVMTQSKELKRIWKRSSKKGKKAILLWSLLMELTGATLAGSIIGLLYLIYKKGDEVKEADKKSESEATVEYKEITIKQGETLSQIAEEYHTTVSELLKLNPYLCNNENMIYAGDNLLVPVTKEEESLDYKTELADWEEKIEKNGYVKGIDISQAGQKGIDLDTVLKKNDIDFVMIRMSYFISHSKCDGNKDYIDDDFEKYAKACAENNVPFGIYYWPTFTNVENTKKELDIILGKIKELEAKNIHMQLPICFDIELKKDGGSDLIDRIAANDENTLNSIAFAINYLQERGYYPCVYTGNNALQNVPGFAEFIQSLNIEAWLARYATSKEMKITDEPNLDIKPNYDGDYAIRQYSESGKVEGYNGYVDLNVCYVNLPKIIRDLGFNHLETNNTKKGL